MKIFNKLVRDKIPEKIRNNGDTYETRILSDLEYEKELNNKLLEEANEVINANNEEEIKEELADLYEVMLAKLKLIDSDISEVEEKAKVKREKHGAFDNKIFLVSTDNSQD